MQICHSLLSYLFTRKFFIMFQLTALAKPQLRLRSAVVPAMVIILVCLIKVKIANSSEADLLKATITVADDNVLQLKAYYGRNMPGGQTNRLPEIIIRAWGNLPAKAMILYAAAADRGTYHLSLITEPGYGNSKEHPYVEITRIRHAIGQTDKFRVWFRRNYQKKHLERIVRGLLEFSSQEKKHEQLIAQVVTSGSNREFEIKLTKAEAPAESATLPEILVTTPMAEVRDGEDIIARVIRGHRFRLVERSGEWSLVTFVINGETETGWIHNSEIGT